MLDKYKIWFENNPKGLTEYVIPFGTTKKIQRPISINGIINHKDTITSYLTMLENGIKVDYYTSLMNDYIEKYEGFKGIIL